jgi:hypothetical protein
LFQKNQSSYIAFPWTVTILRYDVMYSLRCQCGEYSVARYNFLSNTFIFHKQFYFVVSDVEIMGPGNPKCNLESLCIHVMICL